MHRRSLLFSALGASALSGAAETPRNVYIRLRRIQLRNSGDNQRQRTVEFLEKHALPAYQRAGAGLCGVFSSSVGPDTPFLLELISFPSLAAMEEINGKIRADAGFNKALEAFDSQPGLNYVRIESSLLRAFDGFPAVVAPGEAGKRPSRLFEVRMYESNSLTTLRRKIKMFNEGEIGVFQRLGMQPVFFGETVVGPKQPNLVYMLSYEDLAAREKAWRAFGSDPEWQKLRVKPGYSDAEIVSNISNYLVTPLSFSPIR